MRLIDADVLEDKVADLYTEGEEATEGDKVINNVIDIIESAPTVETNEMTQDLIDKVNVNVGLAQPIKDERPQDDFVKILNERISESVCKYCQMNKHCELCEISRVFSIITLTAEEQKGGAK